MDTNVQRVRIGLAERSYDIVIGSGLLGRSQTYDGLPAAATAAVVTNVCVAPLYASRLVAALRGRYARVLVVELPDGEQPGGRAPIEGSALESLARKYLLATSVIERLSNWMDLDALRALVELARAEGV